MVIALLVLILLAILFPGLLRAVFGVIALVLLLAFVKVSVGHAQDVDVRAQTDAAINTYISCMHDVIISKGYNSDDQIDDPQLTKQFCASEYLAFRSICQEYARTIPDSGDPSGTCSFIYAMKRIELSTRLGLNKKAPTPQPQTETIQSETIAPKKAVSNEAAAVALVEDLIKSGGMELNQALQVASSSYAPLVTYYGKSLTLPQIIEDKRRYFDRWPIRQYSLRDDDTMVNCTLGKCTVSGAFDWRVSSIDGHRHADGTASFFYVLDIAEGMKVIAEGGRPHK